jgi:hypothetical protein
MVGKEVQEGPELVNRENRNQGWSTKENGLVKRKDR